MDARAFQRLLGGVKQIDAIRRGKGKSGRVTVVSAIDVKAVREATGLSQEKFAKTIQVATGTLRGWEQGRRQPQGPARALLTAVANNPVAVLDALQSTPAKPAARKPRGAKQAA